jgi:multicomponent Na+:H+ antiporter subunit B
MKSIILKMATWYMLPLLFLFSIFILLRGHYEPGGGFIGGLVAASTAALYTLSHGVRRARSMLTIRPTTLILFGLAFAVLSGLIPVIAGKSFLTGMWLPFGVPVIGSVGTPLLFDVGVYLVVIGVTMNIVFSIAER